jgi:2,4-dienoyl-CoA reductase-like NADH-dependent reductase (Old Yellow Enzyme family)
MTTAPDSMLFEPIQLRDLVLRNRLWVSPMCQYSADGGLPNGWHLTHLAQFATGGAGLILTEATAVVAEGRISPKDTGIWSDEHTAAWRTVVDAVHDRGGRIGMQLSHAGRKSSTWWPFSGRRGSVDPAEGGWVASAPSAVAFDGYAMPVALDEAGILAIVDAFADGARRAVDAGFDVVELHAAHGYLIHQFLSPLSNHRDDRWGGTLEQRAALLLECVRAVRSAIGASMPLLVRFSGTDWAEGGWSVDDTVEVAGWCADAGADFFDISSGGLVGGTRIPVGPGYQVPFAEEVRSRTGLPVGSVGMLDDARLAEQVVASGRADAVLSAREWLRDPHFALRAARELGVDDLPWPPQYERAKLPDARSVAGPSTIS